MTAIFIDLMQNFIHSLMQLLLQPFYYIGILLVVLQYRKQIHFERKLFHTRLHSLADETWRTILLGMVGGLAASLIMAVIGATMPPQAVVLFWAVSLFLIVFRLRFLCFAYSISVIGILHSLLLFFPELGELRFLGWLIQPILQLKISSLLALVAILHLLEAFFIRIQGTRAATPLFYEGKRGKVVGGYHLQGFWPVPLFLLVPVGSADNGPLPWFSVLGGDLWSAGWTILAFPVVIGFAEMTMSKLPQQKARWSSGKLTVYAVVVMIMAGCVELWPVLTIGASLFTILLHELLVWYSKWEEYQRSPLFVHDERGLKILGVIAASPAQEMSLQTGEIIHKVNGIKVLSKEQMHAALQINSAFCKLEIINLEGQSKFVKRAIFSGEHHQLGIILAPDENAEYYVEASETYLISYLKRKLSGVSQKTNSS